jgi:hypothetical protein
MDSETFSDHEAAEHIKLLRRARRIRLVVLAVFVVVTWGLWTTLQAGDQKAAAITAQYDKRLIDLRTKWGIPSDVIIVYSMDTFDIINILTHLKSPPDPIKIVNFCVELEALRDEYFGALGLLTLCT